MEAGLLQDCMRGQAFTANPTCIAAAPCSHRKLLGVARMARILSRAEAALDYANSRLEFLALNIPEPPPHSRKEDTSVIELALNGDEDANAVLCEIASSFIDSKCTLPPILRAYTVERLRRSSEDLRKRPKRRGRTVHTNFRRNLIIVSTVAELVKRG